LTTTTRIFLHPENETRLLSVPVDDSPQQTRAVMRKVAKDEGRGVDFARWHALQTWLQGAEHRVTIPFAERLAELIPPVAVRLRRDFGTLLALIRAHATLHQATRERDGAGRIVATLADYAVVRDLVGTLMAEGVEASVSPTMRATVDAVRVLKATHPTQAVTVKRVANQLGIDSPAALRRVRMASERGYLKNEETRKGRPANLVLADPLPEDRVLLPQANDPRFAAFFMDASDPAELEEAPAAGPGTAGGGNGRASGAGADPGGNGAGPDAPDAWIFPEDAVSFDDSAAEVLEPEWVPGRPGGDGSESEPDLPV
jgi:hypothetical protein